MMKGQAILELQNYVDKSNYTSNLNQLNHIIDLGIQDINSVKDNEPIELIERFVIEYRKIIDVILTDTQITEMELQEHKRKAVITLNSYSDTNYKAPEKSLFATYIQNGLQAINNATTTKEVDTAVNHTTDLIEVLPQREYKDQEMYLNTPTFEMNDIQNGKDPDLYPEESDYRLIQLYHNHFTGLTFPGTSRAQPSLKLFTMSKEEGGS